MEVTQEMRVLVWPLKPGFINMLGWEQMAFFPDRNRRKSQNDTRRGRGFWRAGLWDWNGKDSRKSQLKNYRRWGIKYDITWSHLWRLLKFLEKVLLMLAWALLYTSIR
jgi:hypothetical protein